MGSSSDGFYDTEYMYWVWKYEKYETAVKKLYLSNIGVQWSPIKHRLNFTFDAWFVWSDSIVTNFKFFFLAAYDKKALKEE